MAPSRDNEGSVTRTFRAAVRFGEDFITLEESITLPLNATSEEIQQAVQLGWNIYQAQREALETQIASVRETHAVQPAPITVRDPDAPASERQRNYIVSLQHDLTWSNEQLSLHASEQGIDLVTMNRGQASNFIDGLKQVAEEREHYHAAEAALPAHPQAEKAEGATASAQADEFAPLTDRQYRVLVKLAQERKTDLDAETHQRFGLAATALSSVQAGALIVEWQTHRKTPA